MSGILLISHKHHSLKGTRNTALGLGGSQGPIIITPSKTISRVTKTMNFDSHRLGFEPLVLSLVSCINLDKFIPLHLSFSMCKMGSIIIPTSRVAVKTR